ncbi:MAG: class I SAM-dependent methyltransferase [Firmicutes bacterium]|nr:class I SAM-dependent methyltransferase [Bacillota bacterium]
MIRTEDVIDFFDRLAPSWDEDMVRSEEVIRCILDNAGVSEGKDVLDVACGTGVLIPDYLARGASVTAIDIAPNMAAIAREKYENQGAVVLCGDVETMEFEKQFDCIIVYNAFPHFPDPERLIRRLASLLKPGGTLTVAHGMSREKLEEHHSGSAHAVSHHLMPAEQLVEIFGEVLRVTAVVDSETMYQVAGTASPSPSDTASSASE